MDVSTSESLTKAQQTFNKEMIDKIARIVGKTDGSEYTYWRVARLVSSNEHPVLEMMERPEISRELTEADVENANHEIYRHHWINPPVRTPNHNFLWSLRVEYIPSKHLHQVPSQDIALKIPTTPFVSRIHSIRIVEHQSDSILDPYLTIETVSDRPPDPSSGYIETFISMASMYVTRDNIDSTIEMRVRAFVDTQLFFLTFSEKNPGHDET